MAVVPTTIKLKRGLAANAAAAVLEAGEPMVTLDTGKMWVGDGAGGKILINPDQAAAETAVKLETARTIALGGDATGSTTFDGSANRTITVVLANSGATAGQFTKLTIDAKGRVTSATNITAADIPTLTLSKISDAGTAASKDTGTAVGNIPILGAGGKLPDSVLPALAISDTFVVATQTAMLALTAEVGDIAIRTDLNKTYILRVAGAATLANWQEILAPTGAVSSVAGRTGAVTLTATDVGLASVGNYGVATQAEAEAGSSAVKYMTPQRTAQAIDAQMAVIDGGTF
ncbi:hypothetical protein [Paenibacillus donghaensis]|uniref:Major tropism determinant N-terminal domain-containing protein n=1 Tax=Paenibacillus donghaensis TaxID=414771 RepID=A0A2Z2KA15_9BACL|nr:hypothetical protein [Paenibacillus donghaensis]ASA22307.1 hypothetical protein B9T62_16850 [Paenibacillus donghaensis]